MANPRSNAAYIINLIESKNEQNKMENYRLKEAKEISASEGINFFSESVIGTVAREKRARDKYNSFIESVKASMLGEYIYKVYSESMDMELLYKNNTETIMRSMISNFINENGANNIIKSMRTKSYALSEANVIINTSIDSIRKNTDMKDTDDINIKDEDKNAFLDKLDKTDTSELSEVISQRVAEAIKEFIEENKEDKEDIKEILTNTKEKMDKVDEKQDKSEEDKEAVKESYQLMGKKQITDVRNRDKSIFGTMVHEICKSCMTNDDMKREFFTEGKLDVNKVQKTIMDLYRSF